MSKTLTDEIITIVKSEANNNPAPTRCTITKVYSDGHADVSFDRGSLNYVEVIGTAEVGDVAAVLWLDESMSDYIVIDGGSVQSLTDYVQKSNGANTMTDSSAYGNLETSENATQKQINNAINTKIGAIMTALGNCENLLGGS